MLVVDREGELKTVTKTIEEEAERIDRERQVRLSSQFSLSHFSHLFSDVSRISRIFSQVPAMSEQQNQDLTTQAQALHMVFTSNFTSNLPFLVLGPALVSDRLLVIPANQTALRKILKKFDKKCFTNAGMEFWKHCMQV